MVGQRVGGRLCRRRFIHAKGACLRSFLAQCQLRHPLCLRGASLSLRLISQTWPARPESLWASLCLWPVHPPLMGAHSPKRVWPWALFLCPTQGLGRDDVRFQICEVLNNSLSLTLQAPA